MTSWGGSDPQTLDRRSLLEAIQADDGLSGLLERVAPRLDDDPGHDLGHCLRVALWTLRLGGAEIDAREGVAAALCHDIVNVPKDSPDRARASELCAAEARGLLATAGFAEGSVDRIAAAIRDHSFSRGAVPADPLGQSLQDADRLEAVGAIGIMRCVSTGVRLGGTYFHPDDPWAEARALDDRAFSVDHFFVKLLRLPDTMLTEAGRAEARRRADHMCSFLRQLGAELGIALPEPAVEGQRSEAAGASTPRGSE